MKKNSANFDNIENYTSPLAQLVLIGNFLPKNELEIIPNNPQYKQMKAVFISYFFYFIFIFKGFLFKNAFEHNFEGFLFLLLFVQLSYFFLVKFLVFFS